MSKTSSSKSGLKSFARSVAEIVFQQQSTDYNRISEQLLKNNTDKTLSQTNLRRRVYDALNVLRALELIEITNKTISWSGFARLKSSLEPSDLPTIPPPSQPRPYTSPLSSSQYDSNVDHLRCEISRKKMVVQELAKKDVFYKCLAQRNQACYNFTQDRLQCPFYVIDCGKDAEIRMESTLNSLKISAFSKLTVTESRDLVDVLTPNDMFSSDLIDQNFYSLPSSVLPFIGFKQE
ncbi:hypothetical protein RCL1_008088 [Eukaryota sp. TZLM3-RCL]